MAEKYMNPREAIIELNRLKTGVRTPTDFDRRDRAIETAKAALQKQIPKPPNVEMSAMNDLDTSCPNCDAAIVMWEEHCMSCGQALDWSK